MHFRAWVLALILLTGGAAPLAATLASREVFDAFGGPSKLQALLHGHSYTAYPLGCAAAAQFQPAPAIAGNRSLHPAQFAVECPDQRSGNGTRCHHMRTDLQRLDRTQ